MGSTVEHAADAAQFVANEQRAHWHDEALWFVRNKRDNAVQAVPEWEKLRQRAAEIKQHTLANLADYLEQFEREATRRGIQVHWASTAEEHNQIVYDILKQHHVNKVVKSKSMLTEECHLNPFLQERKIEVVDTDLGERIVQLRDEPPSHIVLPAIHIKKEEVGETFHQHLGTDEGATDPNYLTEAARGHLRDKFMNAEAAITGVNFGIAELGGFVVCTNEGNADLGVSLPKLHIACMGIEKLIPRTRDLGVFTRLLARNATGQPITTYTSHFLGPDPGYELHVVLVDNGRSALRADEQYGDALSCIRCGACLNTCPVYRRSGGHSYHATIPGPIGSILNSGREDLSLPAVCLQPVWFVHGCMPRQDTAARATPRSPRFGRRKARTGSIQTLVDEADQLRHATHLAVQFCRSVCAVHAAQVAALLGLQSLERLGQSTRDTRSSQNKFP
jgi:L-lactate dehydrogenase complex protein LldF